MSKSYQNDEGERYTLETMWQDLQESREEVAVLQRSINRMHKREKEGGTIKELFKSFLKLLIPTKKDWEGFQSDIKKIRGV